MKAVFLMVLACVGVFAAAAQEATNGLAGAAETMRARLTASSARLADVRKQIADDKIPLTRSLSEAEQALSELRREYDAVKRQSDGGTLELSALRNEIKGRETERNYLVSLLGEYARNFETRLHISELEPYKELVEEARGAQDHLAIDPVAAFDVQLRLVFVSLARLEEMAGGLKFPGGAAADDGLVKQGRFLLLGPVSYFASKDGTLAGIASQRVGSLIPVVEGCSDPALTELIKDTVMKGAGSIPFDASLGNARKIEEIKETVVQHFLKGGAVMWPILLLLTCALIVVVLKWVSLAFVRLPRAKHLAELLDAVCVKDNARARDAVNKMKGMTGRMLRAGVEVLDQPRELIEEAMFEKMLDAKASLNRFLPFVAVAAACAPLLGLLGTVTGIISTFNLMTVFGSGDVKMLSSGISEALITTEYGLYVAIPCVLMHSFLSRKAKGLADKMEQIAVRFMCEVGKV
jgi:biopolymer transport protein ExbB